MSSSRHMLFSAGRTLPGFIALVALLVAVVAVQPARANFGPHAPGSTVDNASCAMCHRTHTASSPVSFEPTAGVSKSALLVGLSSTVSEFCLVCHGDGAPGAGTNVISGIFESSAYVTSSTPYAPLNAGGFGQMPDPYAWEAGTVTVIPSTSRHDLETGPVPLWASGTSLSEIPRLTCTSCHDPHPTSNFRMLRGVVNSITVGGYVGGQEDTPNAFVFSTETSYPVPGIDPANPSGGFLKGAAGAAQANSYRPNYTGGPPILNITATSPNKSMSVWCASCHTGYRQTSADTTVVMNYGIYEANPITGAQVGALERHFHVTDRTLENGYGPNRTLPATVTSNPYWVPLETAQGGTGEFYKNYMGCLTCHRAHGASAVMTGWAASHLETNTLGYWMPVQDTTPGIPPAKAVAGGSPAVGSSALLRANNRSVCEFCHGG